MWPSNRKRWWCVLSHGAFGKVPLTSMPQFSRSPLVSDLMDDFRLLPQDLFQQLKLTDSEMTQLNKLGTDMNRISAQRHATMPTALHSWGSALSACKCQCRSQGLSDLRLQKRGFFGTVVRVMCDDGSVAYRYPDPQELAVLVGLPLLLPAGDARLQLAAVGQLASPLQSCWVYACIRRHVEQAGFSMKPPQLLGTGLHELVQDISVERPSDHGTHKSHHCNAKL